MPFLLAYLSRSTVANTAEIIDGIALTSSANNAAVGITGVLLLNGNYFFQVLEGREDLVRALYRRIAEDPRHSEARVVLACQLDERLFDDWFMRAFNLDAYYDVDMTAFRRRLNATVGGAVASRREVLDLLRSFKRLVVETDTYHRPS